MNDKNLFVDKIGGGGGETWNFWYDVVACYIRDMNIHKNKRQRKGLSLTFKQGTRQDYVIQKHNNHEQEHEMCKTNMIFVMLAYANMNMKRTW
jgi:hypothetical protein